MVMIILIHVIIAVSSIVVASIGLFRPSVKKFAISYGFVLATVASGSVLLVVNPSNILHTCLSGLGYLTIVSLVTIASHVRMRRLATENL
ncbi:hypothetical protein BH10PAT4_BH10PAT4_3490 [soil metagenome]